MGNIIIMVKKAHSSLSASGAERWFCCPGSVALSSGLPDKESSAAREGTLAHECLERILKSGRIRFSNSLSSPTPEMYQHAFNAAKFIEDLRGRCNGELLIETRANLAFIDAKMFGTLDAAIIDHFGILHILDYKYGKGHPVSATENLQLIYYALGIAYAYDWNFSHARLWIIQPRIKGYDGPTFWDVSIGALKNDWQNRFRTAVRRTKVETENFVEGNWCFFCKAKSICPLKNERKFEKAKTVFSQIRK